MTNIDVEHSGLLDIIRYELLQGDSSRKPIKAEVYKLNVYGKTAFVLTLVAMLSEVVTGKDAFFKPHKDTPRGTAMFGTLVLVLPAPHEGGELIIRHNGKEWTFDSAKALSEVSSSPQVHIGYATFFSDVEHEVKPVRSGYRVTITYNLHFIDEGTERSPKAAKTYSSYESDVTSALRSLLADITFLPNGGRLGFGLNYEYPIKLEPDEMHFFNKENPVDFISRNLKGTDAVLMKVCKDLKLNARIYIHYDDDNGNEVIIPEVVDAQPDSVHGEEMFWEHLVGNHGAEVVKREDDDYDIDSPIHWVTERTEYNTVKSPYAWDGNKPAVNFEYGQFCLIVEVGTANDRETAI